MKKNDRFQRGSGVYTCGNCGKQTRETGAGESSVEMCRDCYVKGGIENQHTDDNHPGRIADCKECCDACRSEGVEPWTGDEWCDNEPATITNNDQVNAGEQS
jgi:hypothetical protein